MTDTIRDALAVISDVAAFAGNIFNSAVATLTSKSPQASPHVEPQAMHVPNPHDYDITGDMGANETHHKLHSSAAAALAGPNKILLFLTVIVGLWLFMQMVPSVHGAVIRRQDDKETGAKTETQTNSTTGAGSGSFTFYQINGNGTTETPLVQEGPPETANTEEGYTTVFPSTHDGTVHNHVSVVTQHETTAVVTDLVVETDVITVTLSDLDPSSSEGAGTSFITSVVTHTGTWYHTHLPNEEAHTASWTHSHIVTGPPGSEETAQGTTGKDADADGHWPGDPDGEWDKDGDGHGPPGGPETGNSNDPKDGDGDGHWPGDPDSEWDKDGDGHGPPGESGSADGNGGGDDRRPCSFDFENHSSDVDEQIHHSTYVPGQNTLTWAHDITLTYETTNTLVFGGSTYQNVINSTVTAGEAVVVETEIKTLIDNGVTYTDVEIHTSTKLGEIDVIALTRTIVDGGSTYEEVATVTTTDFHFDPVTTIHETEWTEHTRTHPHHGGPTEYLPEHTHHHTFTLYSTVTSTITTLNPSGIDIYTEWVEATTITL